MTEKVTHLIHKCSICNYSSNRKYNLIRHCNSVHYINNDDKSNFLKSGENVSPSGENVSPGGENVSPSGENVSPNQKFELFGFICNKCNKIYASKRYLVEHEKKCKGIDDLTCPTCMISFTTRQAKSKHLKRNNCKPKSIIHARTPNPQNIHTHNNIKTQINNTIETQNITNIANQTVVNNYKNERLDYLDYEKMLDIFIKKYDIPTLLTKEIQFNKEFPENNNIKYGNRENALIKKDNDYLLKDINALTEELINEKTSQMQKFAVKYKDNICLKIERQKYTDIIDLLLNYILLQEPKETYKLQIKNIKDMIKNSKTID